MMGIDGIKSFFTCLIFFVPGVVCDCKTWLNVDDLNNPFFCILGDL